GLIGLDFAAEGPLGKNHKSSFLVNYRYSTVGLLSILGVPLGDEDIRYQDLAFNLYFPTEKVGTFTLFGMGGLSSNDFFGKETDTADFRETSTWKDFFDISFRSNMGATGLTHKIDFGWRASIKSAIAYSGSYTSRRSQYLPLQMLHEGERNQQSRFSASSVLKYGIASGLYLKTGIYASQLGYDLASFRYAAQAAPQIAGGKSTELLLQPFVNLKWNPIQRLHLQVGLHGMRYSDFGAQALEPRFRASLRLATQHKIHAGMSWHSQLQLPGTYFTLVQVPSSTGYLPVNRELGFTRARHYTLNYDYYNHKLLRIRLEAYYQDLYDIPIVADPSRTFSALNLIEGYVTEKLVNAGTGRNYGVELSLEQLLRKHYYYLLSGTIYRSLYTAGDGLERASRFDGRFATAAAMGYEWDRESRKGRQQIFGLNLRAVFRGGMREMPVDLAASRHNGNTVYNESDGFSEQLPNYFRLDLRFTFKRNRPGYTNTLGLDIQNLLNIKNAAYRIYDPAFDQVFLRNQLGIIPLLSYRMEF
ncbi:MAG TPA: TonB-dependent receptor, partial [Bacteroidetes bacterium]|nr:TonB-dependent receptor [Bacteroidota bacterium]